MYRTLIIAITAVIPWTLALAYIEPEVITYEAPPDLSEFEPEGIPTTLTVEVPEESKLKNLATEIAGKWDVLTTTLFNLVYYESRWDPNADNGEDRGLVQINRKHNPGISDEEAFDPEFALNFAAEAIAKGKESAWVVCNCYSLVRTKVGHLPPMDEVVPNTPDPFIGAVAVFQYNVKHIAYVTGVSSTTVSVFEANYMPCTVGQREVSLDDPALLGFWAGG